MKIKYNELGEVISVNGLATGQHLGTPLQDALGTPEENSPYYEELCTVTKCYNTCDDMQPSPSGGNIEALEITENGTYTAEGDVTGYSPVVVNVSPPADVTAIEDGLVTGKFSGIYINDRVTVIQEGLFKNSMLTEVSFPMVTKIPQNLCYNCTELTKANFPSATTTSSNVFGNCTKLTELNIPLVTNAGSSAFSGCKQLSRLDLKNCSMLSNSAIYNTNMTALILRGESVVMAGDDTPCKNTPIANGTGYIYVPSAYVESYKSAFGWRNYANQIRALEDYTVDGTITGELDETKI